MQQAAECAYDHRRTGSLYGAFAFSVIVLSAFSGYFYTQRFWHGEEMVPWVFGLGAVYAAIGILGSTALDNAKNPSAFLLYYLTQLGLVSAMIFISPIRGFFGLIALPLASQSIFDLRPRLSALLCTYLFSINIAVWAIPFGWGGATQAVINYSAAFAFTIVFTIITKRAVSAREREEKLRVELESANGKLRAQAAQMEELATTRERNRMAREIHDGVGHYLTVVKTQLDAAAGLLPASPERARDAVEKAARLTADALEDVRRSVGSLRADAPREPLADAIRQLARHGDPVPTVAIEGKPRPLPPAIEHALFRAAQEGLTNIRKHAKATSALLLLDFRSPHRVSLEMTDNGAGRNGVEKAGCFGLIGLRERIELLGGTVNAANRLDGGFTLKVEVPEGVASSE
jgi:signal transduction histidine kinase